MTKSTDRTMSAGRQEQFDAIVIGTGQGGKPLAGDLASAGWKTAIVERGRVGGTCVVCGCTPTKTMIASARVAHVARRAESFGVHVGPVSVDMKRIRERKRDIVDSWVDGSRKGLEKHDDLELIFGEARFSGMRVVDVALREGGTRRLTADHVFINAGARPAVPPITGLDAVPYLDSTSIMELGEVPEHLLVLGGGFIGLEFGQMFRRFGADVTIVEQSSHLISREDEDVSAAVRDVFDEDGITVLTESEAVSVEAEERGHVQLELQTANGDRTVSGSHLLVALGRTSNADRLNLEATGLSSDERGWIPVDERCETRVDGIWALGDITGAAPFTHTAYDDYRVIRSNLLEDGGRRTTDRLLPYVVFIDPQLGRVGLTEREARRRGIDIRVAKLPMTRVARAIELDETRGFMKAIVDSGTDQILGASILGLEGGEIVSVLQMAMQGGLPWTTLRDAVLAHPTLSESLNNLFMTLD